jgi:hypothetical protein
MTFKKPNQAILIILLNYIMSTTFSSYPLPIQSNAVVIMPAFGVDPPTNAITLTYSASGKTHIIPVQANIGTINLPAPLPGLCYKFVMNAVAGAVITVTPASGTIFGTFVNNNAGAAVIVSKAGTGTFTFTVLATIGDWAEITSDGTNWYCSGASRVIGFT